MGGVSVRNASRRGIRTRLGDRLDSNYISFSSRSLFRRLTVYDRPLLSRFVRSKRLTSTRVTRTITRERIFPYFCNSTLGLSEISALVRKLSEFVYREGCPSRFSTHMCGVNESSENDELAFLGIAKKYLEIESGVRCGTRNNSRTGNFLVRGVSRVEGCSNRGCRVTSITRANRVITIANLDSAFPKRKLKFRRRSGVPVLRPMLGCEVVLPSSMGPTTFVRGLGRLRRRSPRLCVI